MREGEREKERERDGLNNYRETNSMRLTKRMEDRQRD
jgi:hypothetical protein